MGKSVEMLKSARRLAASAATWADLSNALFDPLDGLLAKAYPTQQERAAFVQSPEYQEIRRLIDDAVARTGLVEGATPRKSGRFVVRLPQTLHGALEREAENEGVSLNQLVVVKLAVQLSNLASGPHSQLALVIRAFLEVRESHSTDYVVADPGLNRRFLRRCRELGAVGTDFDLNWALFNARKSRYLTDLPKTKRYTVSRSDEFDYASEMAIRYVQRHVQEEEKRDVSLDKIICDPDLAAEFDRIAGQLASGFTPLEYRWVALGLRKARRLTANAESVELPKLDPLGSTSQFGRAGCQQTKACTCSGARKTRSSWEKQTTCGTGSNDILRLPEQRDCLTGFMILAEGRFSFRLHAFLVFERRPAKLLSLKPFASSTPS